MNVAVFSTHVLWPSHYETDLEILSGLLDAKNKVFHVTCNKELPLCELVLEQSLYAKRPYDAILADCCGRCVRKMQTGRSLLSGTTQTVPLISRRRLEQAPTLSSFYSRSHDNLKSLYIDNYDVGWSLLSTLVSFTRDPFLDLRQYATELETLYRTCHAVYYSTLDTIGTSALDEGYVFNGRFSYTKAVIKAFARAGLTCHTHERGGSIDRYSVFTNHTIHDIDMFTTLVHQAWDANADELEKTSIGSHFFTDRRSGNPGTWKSFTTDQIDGALPAGWDDSHYNVVLFTSSEDEFVGISPQWEGPIYASQLDGVRDLAGSFLSSSDPDLRLYVRIHPNAATLSDSYTHALMQLVNSKVIVIPALSPISSYDLLDKADKVVTFGSTMAIESLYWGKPSILLGKSLYYGLKGPHKPQSHTEAMRLICDRQVHTATDNDAIKCGYFLKSRGKPYKHYSAVDFQTGFFEGVNLDALSEPLTVRRILDRIRRRFTKRP